MIDWIATNWPFIVIPLAIFLFSMIATMWLRTLGYNRFKKWLDKISVEWGQVLLQAIRVPSILWCLFISAYLGLVVSILPQGWKDPASRGLWSIFLISIVVVLFNIVSGLLEYSGRRFRVPRHAVVILGNVARIIIIIVGILVILEIWGVSTSPILVGIILIVVAAALALRDVAPNLLAGLQLGTTQHIKVGDYVKLETGEEGYVTQISWNNTHIKSINETTIIVPNRRLVQGAVIKYSRPLKKAKAPFHFNSRTHLTELTGLKAKNLRELSSILKTVPDSVVYYHTHRFLEEQRYITPEVSNDFALWVTDALGDEVLGERLASVDTFEFPNLSAMKERLVSTIDEYVATTPALREAMEGREFYFMKSVSIIFPTPYVAHDLREFVEALRKISLGSLYYHIFEAKLRLGRGLNDFTIWLRDSLDEAELGEGIARIDPYTYTLEGLRRSLIQLIEKRIK
jgi:small-conductance mechanosensitive channel